MAYRARRKKSDPEKTVTGKKRKNKRKIHVAPDGSQHYKPRKRDYYRNGKLEPRRWRMAMNRFNAIMAGKIQLGVGGRAKSKNYNWAGMLKEFIAGASLKDIQRKHGVNYVYLCKKAKEKKKQKDGTFLPTWYDLRDRADDSIQAAVQDQITKERASKTADGYTKHIERHKANLTIVESLIQNKLFKMVDESKEHVLATGKKIRVSDVPVGQLQTIIRTMREMHDEMKDVHGLKDKRAGEAAPLVGNLNIFQRVAELDERALGERYRLIGDLMFKQGLKAQIPGQQGGLNPEMIGDGRTYVDGRGEVVMEVVDRLFPANDGFDITNRPPGTLVTLDQINQDEEEEDESVQG